MNRMPTEEDVKRAMPKMEDFDRRDKQAFHDIKQLSFEKDEVEEITVYFAEHDLHDLMQVVHAEMRRATAIHGEAFRDYEEAKEAINEEIEEVWEAADRGDILHAKKEAIQAIGVLIKFIRTVT